MSHTQRIPDYTYRNDECLFGTRCWDGCCCGCLLWYRWHGRLLGLGPSWSWGLIVHGRIGSTVHVASIGRVPSSHAWLGILLRIGIVIGIGIHLRWRNRVCSRSHGWLLLLLLSILLRIRLLLLWLLLLLPLSRHLQRGWRRRLPGSHGSGIIVATMGMRRGTVGVVVLIGRL